MEKAVLRRTLCRVLVAGSVAWLLVILTACEGFTAAPWPTDYVPIFLPASMFADPAGDEGSPLGIGTYPSVDITDVALGVSTEYLYIRVDFSTPIPSAPVDVSGVWPDPSKWVLNHGFTLFLNVDGQPGDDIIFRCKLRYGGEYLIATYRVDPAPNLNQLIGVGELGEGGSGFNYMIVRYYVEDLGDLFPRGVAVSASFSSFAESYQADREVPVDTAYDNTFLGAWTTPG